MGLDVGMLQTPGSTLSIALTPCSSFIVFSLLPQQVLVAAPWRKGVNSALELEPSDASCPRVLWRASVPV